MENAASTTEWESTTPPPEKPRRVRVKLHSVTDVRIEMGKIYKEARRGTLDVADASRLAHILSMICRTIETTDLAKRLEALEAGR